MYCLKCGNETEKEQVFCKHCLEVMDKYPVKAGTHIQLPRREIVAVSKKQNRRRNVSSDDQIMHYKVLVRTLVALLGTVCVVLGVFISLYFNQDRTTTVTEEPPIGQNYTVDTTQD